MTPDSVCGRAVLGAVVLFLLGVLCRVVYGETLGSAAWTGDSADYLACADNLVNGNGFRLEPVTTKRGHVGPGYPLFLAGLRLLGVDTVRATRSVQGVLAAGLVLLLFCLGRATGGISTGLVAAGIGAFYPYFLHWSAALLTEWLGMLCFTGCLLVHWFALDRRRLRLFLFAGILLGFSALVRPPLYTLALPFALGIPFGLGWRTRSGWASGAVFLLGAVLAISPWTLRNFLVFGRLIPVSIGSGVALYQQGVQSGPGTVAEKEAEIREALREFYYRPSSPAAELEGDQLLARRGRELILAHPRGYARQVFYNFRRFWSFYPGQMSDAPAERNRWAGLLSYGLLFPFMVWGFGRACLSFRHCWLFLLPIVYLTVAHSLIFGMIRYRMPVEPILVLFAAWGISDLGSRLVTARRPGSDLDGGLIAGGWIQNGKP